MKGKRMVRQNHEDLFIESDIEPSGSLDAENVCGLSGKFGGGASDLNEPRSKIQS
jgi:hypothetical protein